MEIPGEVTWLVDVEAQDVTRIQLLQDNVGSGILATCGEEYHCFSFLSRESMTWGW